MNPFMSDYMLFTSGMESPESFNFWSGVSALSSLVGRRVWTTWGRFRINPNMYIILVSPPGNSKTTSMSFAKTLVREVGDVPFSSEALTKEALVKLMSEQECVFTHNNETQTYAPLSIYSTELSQFLGANAAHMLDFLTTVYDQDVYDSSTIGRGTDVIVGPYLTLLSCTTPDWITLYLKSDVISGGFSRRCVFVMENEIERRIAFPEITTDQREAYKRLLSSARTIKKTVGEIAWTDESRTFFKHWYETHERPKDVTVRPYHRTKHIQALKIAALFAASDGRLYHTVEGLQAALALLELVEVNLPRVFSSMGRNELSQVAQTGVDVVRQNGGMVREKLWQVQMFPHCQGNEVWQVTKYLLESEKLYDMRRKDREDGPEVRYLVVPEKWEELKKKGQTK